jgi:hypothetical protein
VINEELAMPQNGQALLVLQQDDKLVVQVAVKLTKILNRQ